MNYFIRKVASPLISATYFITSVLGGMFFSIPSSLATEASDYEASHPDEQVYFFLNDHLGSVDTVLDDEGNVVERRDFLPYGSERVTDPADPSTTTDHKFTGKEMDEETGLYYYGGRYYDPVIGRFISQDPWEGDMKDPQTLNKYSYVRNNPLKYVDPSGNMLMLAAALPAMEVFAEAAMLTVMVLTTVLHDTPIFTPTPIPADTAPTKPVVSDPVPTQGKTEPLVIPAYVNPYPNNTASPALPQTKLEPLIFPSSQGTEGICGVNMSCASTFPDNPHDFSPEGLEKKIFEGNKGIIMKWINAQTNKSEWEYHEDPDHGDHYHKNKSDGKGHEQDSEGKDHFKPGDSTP